MKPEPYIDPDPDDLAEQWASEMSDELYREYCEADGMACQAKKQESCGQDTKTKL